MRPKPLLSLLKTIRDGSILPDEVLIIDGSTNDLTQEALKEFEFPNLKYFKVDASQRGLTKQRNFGIANVSEATEIIAFLDDDTLVERDYFRALVQTYIDFPDSKAVGGYITNEVSWKPSEPTTDLNSFYYDGFVRKDGSRFVLRKKLGLDSDCEPGFMPDFSHGRSIGFLPPSGKVYPVEQIMGGVASYRKEVFEKQQFSEYFEGYGLYEDADFSLRLAKWGKLYVNTAARLEHHHDHSGRPAKYKYGKMVVRNGWYVWRVKYPNPTISARLKWNATVWLLTVVRLGNVLTTSKKKQALDESLGRISGWISLLWNRPKVKQQ